MFRTNASTLKAVLVSAALAISASVCLPVHAADTIVIQKSKPYVSQSMKAQKFMDFVTLNPGQETLPLTMTFYNGQKGDKSGKGKAPAYSWLHIYVGGDPVLTEDNCKDKPSFTVDMAGNIASGQSQIIIEAGGVPGASLTWAISAPAPTLTSVNPNAGIAGDSITLTGTNFSSSANFDTVKVGDKMARVLNASPTSIIASIPDGLRSGEYDVSVNVAGQTTQTVKLKIKVVPELSSLSLISAPPEMELTITGKNFSDDMSENKVMFGNMQAPISSGNSSTLQTMVPAGIHDPQYRVPVTVESKGVKSKNFLYIDIQNRVYGATP